MSRTMNRAARRAQQGKGNPSRVGISDEEAADRKAKLRGMARAVAPAETGVHVRPYIRPRRTRGGPPVQGPPAPRTFAASESWIDSQFPVFADRKSDGTKITYHFDNPRAVPPEQKRCPGCGHLAPPQSVTSSGHCMDCFYGNFSAMQLEMLDGSRKSIASLHTENLASDYS